MNNELYNNLTQYLINQQLPQQLNSKQRQQFITKTKQFKLKDRNLFKIDKKTEGNLLKVIQRHEMEAVLYMMHNDPTAGHFATDIMFEKIRT